MRAATCNVKRARVARARGLQRFLFSTDGCATAGATAEAFAGGATGCSGNSPRNILSPAPRAVMALTKALNSSVKVAKSGLKYYKITALPVRNCTARSRPFLPTIALLAANLPASLPEAESWINFEKLALYFPPSPSCRNCTNAHTCA